MKNRNSNFSIWLEEQLKNSQFKAEFDRQEPEFAVIRAVIEARINRDLSQKELAHKMGTKQSVISRLESGSANPSLKFLQRLATATDSQLKIQFLQTHH